MDRETRQVLDTPDEESYEGSDYEYTDDEWEDEDDAGNDGHDNQGLFEYSNINMSYNEPANGESWCIMCGRFMNPEELQSHILGHVQDAQPFQSITNVTLELRNTQRTYFPTPMSWSGVPFQQLVSALYMHPSPTFTSHGTNQFNLPMTSFDFGDDAIFDDYETNLRIADLIGKVQVGIDDISTVSRMSNKDFLAEDHTCAICLDVLKNSDETSVELICGHAYCEPCISKWLKSSKKCPVCNADLYDKLQEQQQLAQQSQQPSSPNTSFHSL